MEEKMNNTTNVIKRNGSIQPLDLDKLHLMVEEACNGLSGVSASQVEMNSNLQFYDGISTQEIQEILVKSAADLISLEHSNYQYVAARLLLFAIRKELYGGRIDIPSLYEHTKKLIKLEYYDSKILEYYSEEELNIANSFVDHNRDFLFSYSALRQAADKYLVQDRSTKTLYETPQFMYIFIALVTFANYPKDVRLNYVKRFYDILSNHKINEPTPVLSSVRTSGRQYASCTLLDCGDSLKSIIATKSALMQYVSNKAGIGLNVGRIRGLGSKIRKGQVVHTGIVPFIKSFEGDLNSCSQGGLRKGSATLFFPIWHQEIRELIVLKNEKGNEEDRARSLDYAVTTSKIFYERYIQNGVITLFSPNDVPGLYDAFGTELFDELYVKYENDDSIRKTTVSAIELTHEILNERSDTGRLYILNIDHANTHSSYTKTIRMSNLCLEITLITEPIEHIDDVNGAIALCILSAINVGTLKSLKELEEYCKIIVRHLEELIDLQEYPVKAAEVSTKKYRPLGIGITGLAHYLARQSLNYEDPEAVNVVHRLGESLQYYLLKASNKLAKEKGACEGFEYTKYAQGILPIDTYKKSIDEFCSEPLQHDWEALRQDILEYGLRHTTLTAQMPCESSSVTLNTTNGIEPPRGYMTIKRKLPQIVPQYNKLKNNYTLLWDMKSNDGYFKIVAVLQKFFDQAISTNWNYNPEHYPENKVPMSVVVNDFLTAYSYGHKTAYYMNTYDGKMDNDNMDIDSLVNGILESEENDCESCKI
jgi:ribonucleoside-diphosphate reductase alpha chain